MKNNIRKIALGLCLTGALTACDLDVVPPADIAAENFWQTEKDAWYALNTCYATLDGVDIWDELCTDNAHSHKPWEGNFEMVSFPESSIPDGAEFGVRVSGDSMEPVYHDGQIVWVQQCETLRTGEVGVMIYDGQGYIKAYAEQEPDDPEAYLGSDGVRRMQPVMVSYNKAYAPKPASPELEFRIVGRVL